MARKYEFHEFKLPDQQTYPAKLWANTKCVDCGLDRFDIAHKDPNDFIATPSRTTERLAVAIANSRLKGDEVQS